MESTQWPWSKKGKCLLVRKVWKDSNRSRTTKSLITLFTSSTGKWKTWSQVYSFESAVDQRLNITFKVLQCTSIARVDFSCPFERLPWAARMSWIRAHEAEIMSRKWEVTWLCCPTRKWRQTWETSNGGVGPTASEAGFSGRFSSRKNSFITVIQHWLPSRRKSTSPYLRLHGQIEVDGKKYHVQFWDARILEGYERLRALWYPSTDIFLLCFDITNRASFDSIKESWITEIRHHMPYTPFVLVGNKMDLRKNK